MIIYTYKVLWLHAFLMTFSVLCHVSGMLTPILAEVLYDKSPTWPLAVFGPSMIVAAIFSG